MCILKRLEDSLSVLRKTDSLALRARPSIFRRTPRLPSNPYKDSTDLANYRPIFLTSCQCKTIERMINYRLVWFLKSDNLLTNLQYGFRHLVRLESYTRDVFLEKEHVVTVFFDLEMTYETTWQYGILKDLLNFGLKGRLPVFIQNVFK
ncbi:hypothetical protein BOW37_12795 [Solemya velum gill symbiont]|uniref:reverse transcriptase domain-containing protein n=1 Tax=Solemya velum gill symbiont TaxID=2340 RepID=UPI00099632D1|nr:hypothetical protein BOW37_12795 [Solemya velum gill symbiont]